MNDPHSNPPRGKRKHRLWVVTTAMAALCVLLALTCYRELHTYLIWVKPIPKSVTLDGKPVRLSQDGAFVVKEFFGTHIVDVAFQDGRSIKVAVYPRMSDDNSSSLEITPKGAISHGDLKYTVLPRD